MTGKSRSRYVFRTGPGTIQEGLASALAIGSAELNLAVVAPDNADGREAVAALESSLQWPSSGSFFVASISVAPDGTDAEQAVAAQLDAFHDLHGAKTLLTIWTAVPRVEWRWR